MHHDPARSRLKDLARDHGRSLAFLSGLIGRRISYLDRYVAGGTPEALDRGDRMLLAKYFGIEEAELAAQLG